MTTMVTLKNYMNYHNITTLATAPQALLERFRSSMAAAAAAQSAAMAAAVAATTEGEGERSGGSSPHGEVAEAVSPRPAVAVDLSSVGGNGEDERLVNARSMIYKGQR